MTETAAYGTFAPTGIARLAIRATRRVPDGWLMRRLVMALRRIARPWLRNRPVDVEALGVRMRLRPYNNICEKRMLFTPQFFDATELRLLAATFRDGYVFIDVGANVGAYALFVASRTGPSARVLAVEPQPEIFERLVYNIRLNAFATVKAVDCAVAEKPGEVTLFLDPVNAGESSLKVVASSNARPIRVQATTLLDLIETEGFTRVDAMKLDVEGAEDLILEPFLAAAPDSLLPRLVIIENGASRWQVDVEALLVGRGYLKRAATRLNLVYERPEVSA